MEYTTSFPPAGPWQAPVPSPEKSSQLYIREYPHRAIAIVSSSHALVFRYSATTSEAIANGSLVSVASARPRDTSAVSKCMVEWTHLTKQTLNDYRPLTPRPVYGTLGLISIGGDVFLAVITQATRAATVRPGETVENIASVAFFCLNSADYDDVVTMDNFDHETYDAASVYGQNLSRRDVQVEHPCQELRKLLSNGSFYYSTDFDVTNRLQDRPVNTTSFDIDNFDESFLWNSFMIGPLVQFRSRLQPRERNSLDASRILTSAIRGFCRTMTIPQSSAPVRDRSTGLPSYLTIISRLSCRRAGTRFNSRGIDDDGNVANFVETETTYWSPSGTLFSYAQVRGSVPVFWEQAADLVPGRQKITITRGADGTQPAFNKHFYDLEQAYGAVHILNLLSDMKPGEFELSQMYHTCIGHCPLVRGGAGSIDHALLRETHYDFHAETKGPAGYEAARGIRDQIENSADGFAYFLAEEMDEGGEDTQVASNRRLVVVLQQEGIFRTNCLDCLDRTNLIQTNISQMAVEAFLGHRGEYATADFWSRHSTLWADNGDALSKIYAGTGALKTSFTRHGKMSLSGAVADMRKSVQRLYHNNFTDPQRQITIDMLLGRLVGQQPVQLFDPIGDYVAVELDKRSSEFSSTKHINIWVGTFNLNGRTNGIDQDLSAWLLPNDLGGVQPEIYVVGFQEIVELSAQQIMNSDPSRKHLWEKAIRRCLNEHAQHTGGENYVLLRSGQLVGAALCIFVKTSVLANIKNVEGSVKKTGLSGMAGNKGAVAIRFDYANTQLCFVTAHLAAGFANYDERNRDYATIHHGLRFQRNRGIDDHDSVIWLGDFNYRIGLSNEHARALVKKRDLEQLYENDQLNLQMVAGLAFPYYSEARIKFMPTYRFDIGTDEYDTSEKQRIPAWTDRILRKGPNMRQLSYNSAPLKFSDHRPVFATFVCQVSIVDEVVKTQITQELYGRRKADVGDAAATLDADDTDDEELMGYDAIEPGLPPASSDRQKWWLENGKSARVNVAQPRAIEGRSAVLNPNRPANPFTPTDEPDWVAIPRSSSRQSLSSLSSSPFEHVSLPPIFSAASSSSPAPRRLPPPFDPNNLPGAKGGRNQNGEEYRAAQKTIVEPPPPPPPRRQTGAPTINNNSKPLFEAGRSRTEQFQPPPQQPPRPTSAISQISQVSQTSQQSNKGKPAPPVAKKPAHLSAVSSPTNSPSLDGTSLTRQVSTEMPLAGPTLPIRSSTSSQTFTPLPGLAKIPSPGNGPMPSAARPMLLKRSDGEVGESWGTNNGRQTPRMAGHSDSNGSSGRQTPRAGAVGLPGMAKEVSQQAQNNGTGRPVPPASNKPKIQSQRKAAPAVDLLDSLGDEGNRDLGSWETLKPVSY